MIKESQKRKFNILIGSDIQRDGMYCELSEIVDDKKIDLGEIFFSDTSLSYSASFSDTVIPLDILEWLIETSKKRLPTKINRKFFTSDNTACQVR